jgi:hypothetical protein
MGDTSAASGKEVVLHLDEATATDLEHLFLQVGELIAADVAVPMPSTETDERFGLVYRENCRQLGHLTLAEAMQAELDRRAREQGEQ